MFTLTQRRERIGEEQVIPSPEPTRTRSSSVSSLTRMEPPFPTTEEPIITEGPPCTCRHYNICKHMRQNLNKYSNDLRGLRDEVREAALRYGTNAWSSFTDGMPFEWLQFHPPYNAETYDPTTFCREQQLQKIQRLRLRRSHCKCPHPEKLINRYDMSHAMQVQAAIAGLKAELKYYREAHLKLAKYREIYHELTNKSEEAIKVELSKLQHGLGGQVKRWHLNFSDYDMEIYDSQFGTNPKEKTYNDTSSSDDDVYPEKK